MLNKILLTLLSTITFGLIDGLFFLFFESKIQEPLNKISYFDENSAELLTGGISAASAIMFATIIEKIVEHHTTNVIKHPLLDAIGILLGTFIVIIIYKFFINKKVDKNKNK
tara:strand:+ start:244 stop:579 length:336 start_codon:yes stop_codon:yes gene_type:complete